MVCLVTLFLFLFVTPCWTQYVDPKKIHFNFGNDFDSSSDSNTDENDNILNEKIQLCKNEKKTLWSQVLPFLNLLDANTDGTSDKQTITFELTLTLSELYSIKNLLHSGNFPSKDFNLFSKFHVRPAWKRVFLDSVTNWIASHKEMLMMISATLLLFLLLMYWLYVSKSWYLAVMKMFALFFIASVVTTFNRRYQDEVAKKFMKLKMGVPAQCKPDLLTWYEQVWYFFRGMNSVLPDDCLEYYRAELIDPFVESSIVEAVSETFAKLILTPLPIFFEYVGKGFLALFQVLPWYLWVPVGVSIPFFTCIVLLISKKYRIRTPFISIEPFDFTPASQPALSMQSAPSIHESGQSDAIAQQNILAMQFERSIQLGRISTTKVPVVMQSPARIEDLPAEVKDSAYSPLGLSDTEPPRCKTLSPGNASLEENFNKTIELRTETSSSGDGPVSLEERLSNLLEGNGTVLAIKKDQ